MSNSISLRPSYWASVSGGKDSLFMLQLILSNPDEYPLDGVVHFELEIDYPFIKDVVNQMELVCKSRGIPFVRIKPRFTWEELYNKYGFPSRKNRWCNSHYKMDAAKQLEDFMKSRGFYVVHYIGYCFDEERRWSKRVDKISERYPLVEHQILESSILEWAKTQPIFNHFYETNTRCGCMFCPLASRLNLAYLYKYYPSQFEYMFSKAKETEFELSASLGRQFSVWDSHSKYDSFYLENIIKTKWLSKLNQLELDNYKEI